MQRVHGCGAARARLRARRLVIGDVWIEEVEVHQCSLLTEGETVQQFLRSSQSLQEPLRLLEYLRRLVTMTPAFFTFMSHFTQDKVD